MSQHDSEGTELSPVKRALIELREMRSKLQAVETQRTEPLAIIGMGCRFPGGVRDVESYWNLLSNGVDAIQEIPADRWNVNDYYDPSVDAPGKMATRWGGFVDDIDQFDPEFFNISPREAVTMDPQQRLLLEVAWEALERAGQAPDDLNDSATGVFVGLSTSDYAQIQLKNGDAADIDVYFGTGGAHSVVAGRLSYILGLRGPSIALDTACSSSLVAIHLACQSLRSQECRMALAGGVNTILLPELTVALSKARMMASDGRCKSFDASADGFVRSEGCGIIVLKRLSDAIADADNIRAVIRGSAVNQDGRSSGLTAPNGPSQTAVIRAALANGGVEPQDVSYVEAHGTGTSLGDPIEVQALATAFGEGRSADNSLLIGSVKTNIGHMEAAAGVGGLIKVVLALQHNEIPAHLHFREPSPHMAWSQIPIAVTKNATPWTSGSKSRIAGVSSFGFGGTNAHIVIEEAPVVENAGSHPVRPSEILTLSAKNPTALNSLVGAYTEYLANSSSDFGDICFSANTGRANFDHRLALVAASAVEAKEMLANYLATRSTNPASRLVAGVAPSSVTPGVVFLFTGQGSQYSGMGRALYDSEPVFRRAIDQCAEIVAHVLDRPLADIIFGFSGQDNLLSQTRYAQPALFALEWALAQLWFSWGVQPAAVMGHSLGEDVAACIAGVFSVEDGLRLIVERGRLMQALNNDGNMMNVFADEATVRAAIVPDAHDLSIAAVNAPTNVVISGPRSALARAVVRLNGMGLQTRDLATSNGFHSRLMDPMLESFEHAAAQIHYSEPRIPMVSNITGEFVRPGEITNARYWTRHIRETVLFKKGLDALTERGHRVFLEIGPAPTLVALGVRCLPDDHVWLPSIRQSRNDIVEMMNSLAELYTNGVPIRWSEVYRDQQRSKVTLPTYPFQRERYWHDAVSSSHRGMTSAERWTRIVEAGERESNVGPLDLRLETYTARWSALDRLTVEHMLSTFNTFKVFTNREEAFSIDELIGRCGILPTYHHLMTRWLARLEADNIVSRRADGRYFSAKGLPVARLEDAWQAARKLNSDLPELVKYLEHCGSLLVPVLTGKESPLETIFPGGDFSTAEFLYERWAMTRYFNGIARSIANAIEASRPQGRSLRVMEIGAGTGGMTSALLQALSPENLTYHFTDMSEAFLARAARKFAAYPNVRYGLLNIERSPESQGYSGSFDLVVAANSVHATKDLRASLANIQSILAPGGILLLFEVTDHLPWFEMSVGLIEGWERFEDDIRGDDPLLKPERWKRLLVESGFSAAESWPKAGAPAEVLGHHILIARMPGEIGTGSVGAISNESGHQVSSVGMEFTNAVNSSTDRSNGLLTKPSSKQAPLLREELFAAGDEERLDLLVSFVRENVSHVLRLAKYKTIDRRQRLMDFGIDSLMAVELRNGLGQGLQLPRPLPATLMFDHPTIEAIAKFLLREWKAANQVEPVHEEPSKVPQTADVSRPRTNQVADMSDEEVELLLLRKLGSK